MISEIVRAMLALVGKKQIDLAEDFNMTKQSFNNKLSKDSWSAADLAKAAKACGCKLAIELPDGQLLYIDK